jgi:hypothetical protein
MKTSSFKLLILAALIVAGCSTTDNADAPPKHMKRVQFVQYDTTARSMKASIEVFDQPPARKYKVIALITCEGAYHEEIVMNKAIMYKARQLGADAVIQLGVSSATTGGGTMYGAHHGTRSVFRANAIVFDDSAK